MKLKELIENIPVLECTADPELEISQVHYDSRKVTEGSLFVAVTGFASDGNRFIPMALGKGAAAVVTARSRRVMFPIFWWNLTGWLWRCWAVISSVIPPEP